MRSQYIARGGGLLAFGGDRPQIVHSADLDRLFSAVSLHRPGVRLGRRLNSPFFQISQA